MNLIENGELGMGNYYKNIVTRLKWNYPFSTFNFPFSIVLFFAFHFSLCTAQMTIKGKVADAKGKPVPFATVYLKNTITGALTDTVGRYTIHFNKKENVVVIGTAIGYDTTFYNLVLDTGKTYIINLVLKSNSSQLNEVTISPGSFEANDRKVAVLTTMDVYTTASANGDVVGAIQTLPGIQKVSDQTGLFVRGGDASESAAIVDGLVVQDPFFSPVPGVAQRSRFGPYEFKGISFSSGGYSARYGQALSGILELNTNDLPEDATFNANVNMAGAGISGTQLWEHSALEGGFNYTNTQPFYGLTKTNLDFFQPPVGFSGSLKYIWTNTKGDILKLDGNMDEYKSGIDVVDPDQPDTTLAFKLQNFYSSYSLYYRHLINDKTSLVAGSSYSQNGDTVHWGGQNFDKQDSRLQGRVEIDRQFGDNLFAYAGTEVQHYSEKQQYDSANLAFTETQVAGYIEGEWKPAKWFGIKPGIRYEYSQLLAKSDLAPRVSAAVRLNKYGQISAAYGMFYQDPLDKYLLFGDTHVKFQEATHYILNYQYMQNDRTFRVEGYYKSYSDLIHEITQGPFDPNPYRPFFWPVDNSGYGYAKGADVFWRDKKSIKNFDYWISYSYIDTKRYYENFPTEAMPSYVSPNYLNVVTKYFIEKPGINLSLTYAYNSGRPYYNPNNPVFMGDRSPAYQDLSASMSILFRAKKLFGVFYIGVDNVTNNHNILGYEYSDNGQYRYPILPALYRSAFAGIFLSLTPFKKDEL
ncbi:MAG: TonB-dependent receptor [Bacteroidia bacterium]